MEEKKPIYLNDEQIWFLAATESIKNLNQLGYADMIDIIKEILPFYNNNDKIGLINVLHCAKHDRGFE